MEIRGREKLQLSSVPHASTPLELSSLQKTVAFFCLEMTFCSAFSCIMRVRANFLGILVPNGAPLPFPPANSAFHPFGVGKWVPASAGTAKAGMVHSISGWTRGVQVKLWDPLRARAIRAGRFRGVFTTRRYTNSRSLYHYLYARSKNGMRNCLFARA